MPLYDYQCRTCHKVTEVRHGFGEVHQDACPECGGELARVFSPTGIVFKGSGFYLTDSRKASEAAKSSASSSSGTSSSSDSAKPAEAVKPAESASSTPASAPPASPAPSSGGESGSKKSESSAA